MNFTDEQIRETLKHFKYEIDMLDFCCRWLSAQQNDIKLNNAVLESFLIHARNIHWFLGPINPKPKPTDIYATHVTEHFKKAPLTFELLDETTLKKINRQIAHITTERYLDDEKSKNEKEWNPGDIHSKLKIASDLFLRAIGEIPVDQKVSPASTASTKLN